MGSDPSAVSPVGANGRPDREAGLPRLRVVFCGTSGFAESVLRALFERHEVLAVVTQPDRRAGRGRRLRQSRIKAVASELGLAVQQPERLRRRAAWSRVAALEPEVFVVADYGQIVPRRLLDGPRLGAVNVHASLLPELRGAAPAAWAVARRLPRTGVTTMRMDAGLDTGPILLQQAVDIRPEETGGSLLRRLAPIGARLLLETLAGLADGSLEPVPQDDEGATWAPRIGREDTALDWELPAPEIEARVRAFAPMPGAFTAYPAGGRAELRLLRVHAAQVVEPAADRRGGPPGTLRVDAASGRRRLRVACGEGTSLAPTEVQPAGSRPMSIGAFLSGASLPAEAARARFLSAAEAVELAGAGR